MIHTFEVSGMHCQGCAGKLSNALRGVPGVTSASVQLEPPQAVVEMSTHVPTGTLEEAANRVGSFSLKEKPRPHHTVGATVSSVENIEVPQSLTPLFIIVGYIVGGVLLRAILSSDFSAHSLMSNFMGGFFVVFSLFKMINLEGFADGYSTYDLVAKRSRAYALAYPFIELVLGVMYFAAFAPILVNGITVALMLIGSIGVAQALSQKRAIQCACLGTALKLPMTKVTLVEDLAMGAMALVMLVWR